MSAKGHKKLEAAAGNSDRCSGSHRVEGGRASAGSQMEKLQGVSVFGCGKMEGFCCRSGREAARVFTERMRQRVLRGNA